MSLAQIYAPIEVELQQVSSLIQQALERTTLKPLYEINQYIIATPGKRIRPSLALLSYKALTSKEGAKDILETAASLELIHMASLVHDDIIDHAQLRHNKPSVNAKWGSEIAIPMGVYLYAISLQFMASMGNVQVLRKISHTVKQLCEGEMTQIFDRDHVMDLHRYLVILKKKTAVLFGAACYSGAVLAKADKATILKMKQFGYYLGMVFQIVDDYLDIMGETQKLGKAAGQDFFLGEVTLPLLFLLDSLDEAEKKTVQSMIASKDMAVLPILQKKLIDSGALEKTKELAIFYLTQARQTLAFLPETPAKEALITITHYMKARGFNY